MVSNNFVRDLLIGVLMGLACVAVVMLTARYCMTEPEWAMAFMDWMEGKR